MSVRSRTEIGNPISVAIPIFTLIIKNNIEQRTATHMPLKN